MILPKELISFVKTHTNQFDESHDYNHALRVYENALLIIKGENYIIDIQIIQYCALLHDVRDHKYTSSISEEKFLQFVISGLGQKRASIVINVIDNVSYSKQIKGLRKNVCQPYLDIISDADKLEAIGPIGLQRCIAFNNAKQLPHRNVILHCHQKLLRLKDEFIVTKTAKNLAEPLHQFILNYVKSS